MKPYKMVDFSLLQDCLFSFAACSNCKRTSCIKLFTDPSKERYGLAEHFIMRCEICKYKKSSYTSAQRKMGRKVSLIPM